MVFKALYKYPVNLYSFKVIAFIVKQYENWVYILSKYFMYI